MSVITSDDMERVRTRTRSALEVIQAHLERIEAVDPYINAMVAGMPIAVGWMAETGFGLVDREIVVGVAVRCSDRPSI